MAGQNFVPARSNFVKLGQSISQLERHLRMRSRVKHLHRSACSKVCAEKAAEVRSLGLNMK